MVLGPLQGPPRVRGKRAWEGLVVRSASDTHPGSRCHMRVKGDEDHQEFFPSRRYPAAFARIRHGWVSEVSKGGVASWAHKK
jgi:hypothetical protein